MRRPSAEVWRNWAAEAPTEALDYFQNVHGGAEYTVRRELIPDELRELLEDGARVTIIIERRDD